MASDDTPSLTDLAADLADEAVSSDVNEEPVEQTTTESASSTEDTKESETAESVEEPAGETDEQSADEEPTQSAADKRKAELQADIEAGKQALGIDPNTEIRDMVAARRAIREAVEAMNAQVYAPQTPDEIMAETGQSQAEARITAMEQRQELADYNNRVAETQLVLRTEAQRVVQDFPMFNEASPDYNPQLAAQADRLLGSTLEIDPNTNQVVGYKVSPYELYQTLAQAHHASAVENQIKGQKSAEQMLAAAEPQSSAVPKQAKVDPFLAGLTKGLEGRLSSV